MGRRKVDRMQRGPHAGNAEVKLQMAVAVQGDAGHAIPSLNAQRGEGIGELAGAFEIIGVGITEDFLGIDGDEFLFGEIFCRPQQKGSQQQGIIHHGHVPPFLKKRQQHPIHCKWFRSPGHLITAFRRRRKIRPEYRCVLMPIDESRDECDFKLPLMVAKMPAKNIFKY